MADIGEFSEKIQRRLFQQAKEKAQRQLQVGAQMKELLEKREKFNEVAHRTLTSVVIPRVQELQRNFENAKIKDPAEVEGYRCVCGFSPTERFPASVTLDIALSPSGFYEKLDIYYGLEILPALMEFKQYDWNTFNLGSPSFEEEIGRWVEEKILDFIETYLKLETHPSYHEENYVTDPVCDMRFPIAQAADRIEEKGRTIYFCSEFCKEKFLQGNK